MNTRLGFFVGLGLALLLVVALIGGWWLASDHGGPVVTVVPAPVKVQGAALATISPIPVQGAVANGKLDPVTDPSSLANPKFEERDLPPGEDIAKFLNGQADSSLKPEKK
jgi:multidrug efflux pump subunit AcrA (membrane-fusion protein)